MHKSDRANPALPAFPRIELRIEREIVDPHPPRAYLVVHRLDLVARFDGQLDSETFRYDAVGRTALDAVVVVPHHRDENGVLYVLLRSALRPPVAFRPREAWPVLERATLGHLWEVPAGLVEPDERSEVGLRRCAARELLEEVGAEVRPSDVIPLGPSTFPAPGVIGERHFYFRAQVDPRALTSPAEDGTVLERRAAIVDVTLEHALDLVRAGEIEDAKTEIALRRFAEALS
jgi:ADP-ribose pyrophosphatase